jgi:hypothetical protein
MTKYIMLDTLRPNNWFLDRNKLDRIREIWRDGNQGSLPAVEVILIDNEFSLIDGHCRAFVAMENGAGGIMAEIKEPAQLSQNLDWLIIFHRQGPYIGVKNLRDLGKRIIDFKSSDLRSPYNSRRMMSRKVEMAPNRT